MKKILTFMLATLFIAVSANAQTALQTSKVFDNVSVGVEVGATTPLSFNSVFPLNTVAGIKLQKDLTPVFGLQAEGIAIFGENNGTFIAPAKTFVKGTNVGLNGVLNLSNAIWGFKGTPRTFEVSAVAGLGWLHEWETADNFLTAKTGADLAFNLGKTKAHSIVLTPAVLWNLNKGGQIQFNKQLAQLALTATYVYHFKTSNGTHSFKTWDIGALNSEINSLREELAKKPQVIETVKVVDAMPTAALEVAAPTIVNGTWVVQFAKGSAELTSDATNVLNTIPEGTVVDVVGTASPEGTEAFNQALSEARAKAVADVLTKNGVKVNSVVGKGVDGDASNRLTIVTAVQ